MIIPIIQTESVEDLQQKINLYASLDFPRKPGHFQIDIVDGLFADYYSVQPSDLQDIDWLGFTYECHLLVNDPEEYLGEVHGSGAKAVIAQVEHLHNRPDFIAVAKQLKMGVGLALDLYTPVSELSEADLFHADLILLMSVKAGFPGQEFNPLVLSKIQELRARNFQKPIEIDGGINADNIPDLLAAGAAHLAINSALWHDGTVEKNLQKIIEASNSK